MTRPISSLLPWTLYSEPIDVALLSESSYLRDNNVVLLDVEGKGSLQKLGQLAEKETSAIVLAYDAAHALALWKKGRWFDLFDSLGTSPLSNAVLSAIHHQRSSSHHCSSLQPRLQADSSSCIHYALAYIDERLRHAGGHGGDAHSAAVAALQALSTLSVRERAYSLLGIIVSL